MKIEDISFDNQDRDLYFIDDLQLKADAIRYSILPKLEIINNELISRIIEFYKINFYENYSVAKTPHFRLSQAQRKEPTKTNYTYAGISITGQRKENKWFGLEKASEKTPKIAPASLSIDLIPDGLFTSFFFNYPKNFTRSTYKKFYDFFIANAEIISGIAHRAQTTYDFVFFDTFTLKEDLKYRYDSENYDVALTSAPYPYPINYQDINNIIYSNILLFPLLNSCIQLSLGNEQNFKHDLKILEENILEYIERYFNNDSGLIQDPNKSLDLDLIKQKAEVKIKVQTGIRWQVMQRDNWKCCACGRSAEDNIILHVDHIIPRSKGGEDHFDNYQTLCDVCNIGKSNKDHTDLRRFK